MKFNFKIQSYQTDAVNSIVSVFAGQPKYDDSSENTLYARDIGKKNKNASKKEITELQLHFKEMGMEIDQYDAEEQINSAGYRNADIVLSDDLLLDNIKTVQAQQNIHQSSILSKDLGRCSLDVEMETGTGKTYVYIKTMFELNKQYGWNKFIIVVPSIAIREGVKKSMEMTVEHFMEILGELQEYEVFKKKVLLGYFSDVETRRVLEDLYKQYSSNKEDLMNIIHEARQEHEKWKNIVDLFNARFYVPFKARIDNQEDIILKQETPKLSFVYKKQTGEDIKQSRDEILKILSKGEMRAFFILQMIFEIEARKEKDEESLIVLDDISDSFDYQNKFAIIEYINDISNSCNDKFKIILLTHNFDFYRNATQRLRIKKFFMATKEKEGNISLHRGPYIMRTPLDNEIKHTNTCNFISMIPFVRNIVEYTEGSDYDDGNGKENNDFMTLTNCLHLLDRTNNLTDIDIDNIIRKHIKNKKYNYITTGTKIIDIIYDEARKIVNKEKPEELQIEDKIVLSIAIRLKAETYMRRELLSLGETEESLQSGENQMTKWIDKMRNRLPDNTVLKILERVNMMTPECIHINSFMYEPLIDMSIRHLVKLYEDVNDL